MKILALDSSGMVASVAIAEDGITVAEYSVNHKKTHSQTLLPMLQEVTKMTELELLSIDALAIAAGPGSFTGLRIGSATVKGLGFALDKPVVEVPTLDGLAFNLWGAAGLVCPILDARRGQVYTGIYRFDQFGQMKTVLPQSAMDMGELIEKLNELAEKVTFLGDGVPVFTEKIKAELKTDFAFAPAHMNRQRAASVAALGSILYAQGKAIPAGEHKPEYLRQSQAERERAEKENG